MRTVFWGVEVVVVRGEQVVTGIAAGGGVREEAETKRRKSWTGASRWGGGPPEMAARRLKAWIMMAKGR